MGVSIAIRPFLYCYGSKRYHLTPLFSRIFRIFADMKTIAAFLLALSLLCHVYAVACTSAIVGGHLTPDGRPLLWKHRDTGTEHNFVACVAAHSPGEADFVALFNADDTLLREAWIGVNSHGFAVMNTASYNLAPDTASYRDMEGVIMARALKSCRTVADFAILLDSLPKPLGVQANFGVIDSLGNSAYFETGDYGYTIYDVADSPEGYIIRTNYSCSGDSTCGYGYIRLQNAEALIRPFVEAGKVTPETFTECLSRSFYHSLLGRDMLDCTDRWIVDQDFIPRYSSSASVVIDGGVMWTVIGYPPCSYVLPATVEYVPAQLAADPATGRSALCDTVVARKHEVFPVKRGSGQHYIDAVRLKSYCDSCRSVSLDNYREYRDRLSRGDFRLGGGHD